MKKLLSLVALLLTVSPLTWALDVDATAARAIAERFLLQQSGTERLAMSVTNLRLAHAEMNSKLTTTPVYYIFNSDNAFVIVSGDDRAQEVLACGEGSLDMNAIPENMKFWLDTYKDQIEYLQAHPGLAVDKTKLRTNLGVSVAPMIEAMWNQGYPYYSQCPMITSASVRAQTGCAATSLAQVFYKWKYPTQPTPVIPGYTTKTYGLVLEALPSVTFDWDNILPTYNFGDYTQNDEHHRAIAQLMRYIGQAEQMDYTDQWGEANEVGILRACHTFGYVNAHIAYKSILFDNDVDSIYIDNDTWEEMLQGELIAGRPVVYCAVSYSSAYEGYYGHAFNVDGYDATMGLYSINWGWSGTGNGYFALNAFANQGYDYNLNQLMVMGIEPPAPIEAYDPVMLPANEDYITLTSFRADWTDETPVENVTSYTLEVNPGDGSEPGVYELIMSESFPYATTNETTPIKKIDSYTTNQGWSCSNAYEARGGIRLGGGGNIGTLTTPALDMTQSGGKMTVVVNMRPHTTTDVDIPVSISCGNSVQSVIVNAEQTYTFVLDCEADTNQKVTFTATSGANTKRIVITQVDIYSATNDAAKMLLTVPVETGDSTSRTITDITDKFYNVTGLTEGGTFTYRVRAHYVNGTRSAWSNIETVTLFENGHAFEPGDLNHDGSVSIGDIAALIDYMLGNPGQSCDTCADVNSDGNVSIGDVAALIDKLLNK